MSLPALRTLVGITVCTLAVSPAFAQPGDVHFNDNRKAAGASNGGAVTVELVAGLGDWFPDGKSYPAIRIQAFGEEGGPLTAPGPLLRVAAGTELVVSVRNAIPGATLEVHGLYTRPAETDASLVVPAGERRTARFSAGAPGTYFYWATTSGAAANQRFDVDSQLNGAFVVDEPGRTPSDRVFVLGEWFEPVKAPTGQVLRGPAAVNAGGPASFSINGRSWPLTERTVASVGETLDWRWVNLTNGPHPLHLHGQYYTVVATGTLLRDSPFSQSERLQVVTELVPPTATMRMKATPERPGHWLFHCHIAAHMAGDARGASTGPSEPDPHQNHGEEAMAGMVLGIEVSGAGSDVAASAPERRLTMALGTAPAFFGPDRPGIAVSFSEAGASSAAPSTPGPPLLLTRGQPVRITIENHLDQATAVHWHGMELDSYFDGVPGYSGTAGSVTPSIAPGASFEARFTPPRSGTFIYHTHRTDGGQLPRGLYGAMVVTDAATPFDPETDKIVLVGLYGRGEAPPDDVIAINGNPEATFELRAGTTYRFRLINITANNVGFNVTLTSPRQAIEWRAVAKDGADLPSSQQLVRRADRQSLAVGETYDFAWQPSAPGLYWLEVRRNTGEWMAQARVTVVPE
jgi:FtsP/CotA-like multicopper oxidase with cupredoxin domain